jgi:hypothetical protein
MHKLQQLEETTRVLVEKEGRFEIQFNCAIWFLLCFSKNFFCCFSNVVISCNVAFTKASPLDFGHAL